MNKIFQEENRKFNPDFNSNNTYPNYYQNNDILPITNASAPLIDDRFSFALLMKENSNNQPP